ncbi:MAG: hypothetical protein Kow0059_20090 [Candidatus Sumerlaeia bacterium]
MNLRCRRFGFSVFFVTAPAGVRHVERIARLREIERRRKAVHRPANPESRYQMGTFMRGDDKFLFDRDDDHGDRAYGYNIIHYIFSTEGQQDLIPEARLEQLWAQMAATVRNMRSVPLAIGGTSNHVHLLIDVNINVSIEECVNRVREESSRWVRRHAPGAEHFAWQHSYAAFSVGDAGVNVLSAYIHNQAAIHRTKTFQQEFREYLDRHQMDYDEHDMWE